MGKDLQSSFIKKAGFLLSLLFPIFSNAMSASGGQINLSSCNLSKNCYRITASKVQTSQFTPIWKFYDGSFLLLKNSPSTEVKIEFKEATWDQLTNIFYFSDKTTQYSFYPATGNLRQ